MPCLYSSSSSQVQFPFLINNPIPTLNGKRSNLKVIKPGKLLILAQVRQSHNLSETGVSNIANGDKLGEEKRESSYLYKKRIISCKVKQLVDEIRGMPIKDILDFVEKDCSNWNVSHFNHLLSALLMQNEQDIAFELYSHLPKRGVLIPDSRTFSIMVRCQCKRNELEEAKLILDDMLESGFHPDVTTFTILIDSFCKMGNLQRAFDVFEEMKRIRCKPTIQTYNCLLKGLCYVGRVEEAYEMLMDGIKNEDDSVTPDIYTYTAVMNGLCKVGRSNEAKELLHEAMEIGLKPGPVTYNTLLDGYCREGEPMKGFSVLRLMKKKGYCFPDYITYSTLLNGLLRWGKIRAAINVYKEMGDVGLEVEERMMNRLLRRVCTKSWEERDLVDDVCQVFDKMTERSILVMDPNTYGLLIRAFCVGGRSEEALSLLNRTIRLGFIPRTITFNVVIQTLSKEGKMKEALSILVVINEHGKIPSRTSYDDLIHELNRRGRFSAARNVYGAALKQRVIPHRKPE